MDCNAPSPWTYKPPHFEHIAAYWFKRHVAAVVSKDQLQQLVTQRQVERYRRADPFGIDIVIVKTAR